MELTISTCDVFWQEIAKNLPSLILILLLIFIITCLRRQFVAILNSIAIRIKAGTQIKIGSVEIGAFKVRAMGDFNDNGTYKTTVDPSRNLTRNEQYDECRGVMLVHKIFTSITDGQDYDILIYVIPHHSASLIQVKAVEYFFGKFWHDKVYRTSDRNKGFAIRTSAYGEFLCTAKIIFTDDKEVFVHRYIDFEMGEFAPVIKEKELKKPK